METNLIEADAGDHRAAKRQLVDKAHLDREQIKSRRGNAAVCGGKVLVDMDWQRVPGRGKIQKLMLRYHVRPGTQHSAGAYVFIENIVHRLSSHVRSERKTL